jgi:hypothetical protein
MNEIDELKELLELIPQSFRRRIQLIKAETNLGQRFQMTKELLKDQNDYMRILEKIKNTLQETKAMSSDNLKHIAA